MSAPASIAAVIMAALLAMGIVCVAVLVLQLAWIGLKFVRAMEDR